MRRPHTTQNVARLYSDYRQANAEANEANKRAANARKALLARFDGGTVLPMRTGVTIRLPDGKQEYLPPGTLLRKVTKPRNGYTVGATTEIKIAVELPDDFA